MKSWLSIHIFYAQPWEHLLIHGIKPLCKELMQRQWIQQYFFIRYWENGPHIRLRVKGDPEILEKQVEPLMQERLRHFLRKYPSIRPAPEGGVDMAEKHSWFPNNTLRKMDYEPETERYGGPHGLEISEKQFEASSCAVLEAMASTETWNIAKALGMAIQMHLGFAFAVGMSLKEGIHFFSRNVYHWLPMTYDHDRSFTRKDHCRHQDQVLMFFQQRYQRQEKHLLSFCRKVWNGLQESRNFEQAWLHQWVSSLQALSAMLREAQQNQQLVKPAWHPEDASGAPNRELWYLFDSYVHMTNNRLGVLNNEEAYIAYLIRETLLRLS